MNSTKDVNYGAGAGIEVEENYYENDGHFKRFFNREQIEEFFKEWQFEYFEEIEMKRYKESKMVWEFAIKKQEVLL